MLTCLSLLFPDHIYLSTHHGVEITLQKFVSHNFRPTSTFRRSVITFYYCHFYSPLIPPIVDEQSPSARCQMRSDISLYWPFTSRFHEPSGWGRILDTLKFWPKYSHHMTKGKVPPQINGN